jgi:hypothetical protein
VTTAERNVSRKGERVRVLLGAEPVGVILYEQADMLFVELADTRFGSDTVVAGYRAAQLRSAAPVEWIERGDGTRLLRDQTGTEVDMAAAEVACGKCELTITVNRPSAKRREQNKQREAEAFSVYERYGIRSDDPSEPVDLILRQGGFELARVEPPIGQMAKALHGMLAEHNLLGGQS